MARPKAADYDETRNRILTRAVQAFAESGYPSASMASLAERCETSKAALYHYFDSKEAILFESLDRYTSRLRDVVEQAIAPHGGAAAFAADTPAAPAASAVAAAPAPDAIVRARQALASLIRALLVEYRDSQAYHVALLNDVKFLSPSQRARIQAQQRAIVATLSRALAAAAPGRFTEDEIRPATMAVFGMINFTFAWLRPDGPMGYDGYAALVTDITLTGIAGERPGDPR